MTQKPKAVFLDFATLGPGIDTGALDRLLDVTYYPYSDENEIAARIEGAAVVLLAPDIPNLIVTPHVAWAALEARQRALNQVAENVAYFLEGRALRRIV